MAKYVFNPFTGKLDTSINEATITQNITGASEGGYEFTGGFAERTTGALGTSIGTNVEYTSDMVAAQSWYRFGFSAAQQQINDAPYWGNSANPDEAPHSGTTDYQGIGAFSGSYMPANVTNMFSFDENTTYNQAVTTGDLKYNAALGSLRMDQLNVGDFIIVRFDFNAVPQFANSTLEVGLIWSTRDSNDNITFTFPLLTQPLFFGSGTTGRPFLCRPIITAYIASEEDVNARALLAIRCDEPIFIQPLTTLYTVKR